MYEAPSRPVWPHLLRHFVELLLPTPCLACDSLAPDGVDGLGLCAPCRGRIRPVPPSGCRRCARPLGAACPPPDHVCLECRFRPPPHDRLLALWKYAPPIDSVIRALKFAGLFALARPLAHELDRRLAADGARFDLITFVPLHWRRRLARGYDQAEELARALSRQRDCDVARLLLRRRATRAQSRLPRSKRFSNLTSAFRLRRRARATDKRILLVDDVVTSGATLAAAATCLRSARPYSITAVVLARTPLLE